MLTGLVMAHTGRSFEVQCPDGLLLSCRLRGRLSKRQAVEPVVIGAWVDVAQEDAATHSLVGVRPHHSALYRPRYRGPRQVMAANVDQLTVVQSARQPPFKRRLAERFLGMAARDAMTCVLVLSKCDLEEEKVIKPWLAPLREQPMQNHPYQRGDWSGHRNGA